MPNGKESGRGYRQEQIHSSIDRDSLRRIAALGGGRYFELDTEPDAVIASKIINDVRKLGRSSGGQKVFGDLYWPFLLLAALLFGLGVILRR